MTEFRPTVIGQLTIAEPTVIENTSYGYAAHWTREELQPGTYDIVATYSDDYREADGISRTPYWMRAAVDSVILAGHHDFAKQVGQPNRHTLTAYGYQAHQAEQRFRGTVTWAEGYEVVGEDREVDRGRVAHFAHVMKAGVQPHGVENPRPVAPRPAPVTARGPRLA